MTTRPDNEHLWTKYADHHAGYCLEFENRGIPFSYAVNVIYEDELAIDFSDPADRDWKFLIRKTPAYKVEEEVRMLRLPRGQPHEVTFEPRLLRRVILGNRMEDVDRVTICEWCRVRVRELLVAEESENLQVLV